MPKRSRTRRSRRRFREPFSALGSLLVWAVVLLVPLVIAPTAADTFRLPKLMLAEWLGLTSLLAFALAAVLGGGGAGTDKAGGEAARGEGAPVPRRAPWRGRAFVASAPAVAVATLGLAFTEHPEHVRQALADLWIGAACLVGWSLALPSRKLERLLAGLAFPGALLAVLGILQFHGIYRPFAFTRGEEAERLGVSSLAGNTGDLAAFLVLPALVAQWRMASSGASRRDRALWTAALVLCCYGIIVTQTLTALAALLAGSLVLWTVRLPLRKAAGALAALVVGAVIVAAVLSPVRQRVEVALDVLSEGRWNAALSGRLDGWMAALWMVERHPVLGVGHGAYRTEFAPAKLALLEEGVELYRSHADPFFANAHNELLEVGAEWGVLGWLALAWALWVLLRAAADGWLGSKPQATERKAFAWGVLAALGVLALGQFPFRIALVAYPALLLLAWTLRSADEAATRADEGTGGRAGPRKTRLWVGGAAAVLVVAVVLQTDRWIDRVGASKRIRVVETVTASAASSGSGLPGPVTSGNIRLLRQARALDPSEVAVAAGLASQYLMSGTPARAEEAYLEALALEPRPELYLNLGRARLAVGERDGAIEAFRAAVLLDPRLVVEIPRTMRQEVAG